MTLAITNCDSSPPVAETQRKSYYKENGCVHAAGLLPARLVDVLASAIDTNLHSMLSPRADVTEHDGGKKFTMDYCNYHEVTAYQTIAEFLAPIAAELMNSIYPIISIVFTIHNQVIPLIQLVCPPCSCVCHYILHHIIAIVL